MRYVLSSLICCVVLLSGATVSFADMHGLDARDYQLWERHWRFFAQRCAKFEDEFICCPSYQQRYPSSAGITLREAQAKLTEKVDVGGPGVVITKTINMPKAEAQAMALPLPRMAVGEYGYLESVEVEEVLGTTSMFVTEPTLIDTSTVGKEYKADRAKARQADDPDAAEALLEYMYSQREALAERQKHSSFKKGEIRLEGFSTKGLSEGVRWDGPRGGGLQVLMVRQEVYGPERRPKLRFVAVALDKVEWGLDEQQFVALLKERGMNPKGFVDLVMAEMAKADPEPAQLEVFQHLLPPVPDPSEEKDSKDSAKDET